MINHSGDINLFKTLTFVGTDLYYIFYLDVVPSIRIEFLSCGRR